MERKGDYYNVVDDMLTLCDEAEPGDSNKDLLGDLSWDRKYHYGPGSIDYDPTLFSLFSGFLDVIGPSEDSCTSSSSEEDL